MPKTKEDHKASFEKSLGTTHRFRSKISTGMDWPDNIHGRRYCLTIKAVTDETVTFDVSSADIEPRDHRGYNSLEHGEVEVFIIDDIDEVVRTGIRAADPEFFDKYTPVPNHEAWEDRCLNGVKFSKGYKPFVKSG